MNKLQSIILIGQLFFITACSNEVSEYDKIQDFIRQNSNIELKDFDFLVVVNEQGDCMNCNNLFSKSISSGISNKKVLFLISSSGVNIDISPYIEVESSNVILDFGNYFSDLNIVEKCAIIDLGFNKIDTIINIDLSNVHVANDMLESF